jgi:hypothetical protein
MRSDLHAPRQEVDANGDRSSAGAYNGRMGDVLFIAITIAFILVCVAYVAWCDQIIGPDELVATATERELEQQEVAA